MPVPRALATMSPILVFEVIAVVLGALSAMITAAKKNFDFVGTYALACVVSFGGGTIRDVLLDRRPFFWVDRWEYLVVIFVLCIPFVYSRPVSQFAKRLVARGELVDALGLGFFAVVGCTLALQANQPVVVAVLLGVITSTGGGILGDVLTNDVPNYFRHGSLYTTAAFAGAVSFTVLRGLGNTIAVPVSISLAVGLRLLSVWRGASLPRPHWLQTGAHPIASGEHRVSPAASSDRPPGSTGT
jgi:uncharacterized membrane protein YeiH